MKTSIWLRFSRVTVLMLAGSLCGLPACGKTHHPTFMAPGFELGQTELVCVMPLLDARSDPRPQLNLEPLRPFVVHALEIRGYRVNSNCPANTAVGAMQPENPRYLLTVRVDALWVAGSVLTASLFDTQAENEVWKDTAMPGFGGRYANALTFNVAGAVEVDQLIRSSVSPLFETLDTRKKKGR